MSTIEVHFNNCTSRSHVGEFDEVNIFAINSTINIDIGERFILKHRLFTRVCQPLLGTHVVISSILSFVLTNIM